MSDSPDRTLESAKQIFFRYDGSRFYMSRDGLEEAYLQARVPAQIEAAWLAELTDQKVDALGKPGNWSIVHFLTHHGDFRHTRALLDAEPKGKLWERVAFLEELVRYIQSGPHELRSSFRDAFLRKVTASVALQLSTAKSAEMRDRLNAVSELVRRVCST